MDSLNNLKQFLSDRDWGGNVYAFISPVFSLIISLYLIPLFSKLDADKLLFYLESKRLGDKFEIISAFGKDRALQVAYLTGVPSFFCSLVATLKSNHPTALTAIPMALLIPLFVLFLRIFIRTPGYHATTRYPAKAKPDFVYRKGWTYLTIYSKILVLLNVLFILVIIIALPEKKP